MEKRFRSFLFWGDCFHLGAPLCRRMSSYIWLQELTVADVMSQSRQEDSDFIPRCPPPPPFFFFISNLPPGMFWQGRYHFILNVNVETFQSFKLQRFLSMTQRNKKSGVHADHLPWGSSSTKPHNLLPCYRSGHERQCPWVSNFDFVPLITVFLCKLCKSQRGRAGFSLLPSGRLRWWVVVWNLNSPACLKWSGEYQASVSRRYF